MTSIAKCQHRPDQWFDRESGAIGCLCGIRIGVTRVRMMLAKAAGFDGIKKKRSKGDRDREMRAMYIECQDVRKVAAHFQVYIRTVRKNIRRAQNREIF